jgi:hypothetical protein
MFAGLAWGVPLPGLHAPRRTGLLAGYGEGVLRTSSLRWTVGAGPHACRDKDLD